MDKLMCLYDVRKRLPALFKKCFFYTILPVVFSCIISSPAFSTEMDGHNNIFVSLHVKNQPVSAVLDNIEKQTNYFFFYNNKDIDVNHLVSIDVENRQLNDVLDLVFGSLKIQYSILEKSIILSNRKIVAQNQETAQGITITGTIVDASGETLPGVNVAVKGTSTGTTSDLNGRYEIQVPDGNAVLVFSFVGFTTQEAEVGNRQLINVTLLESISQLDEVVVIGYGTVRKKDLTGSVASIKSDEIPKVSAGHMLQGRLAGVNITTQDGRPGAQTSIRIRGTRSMSQSNEPLVIVDGVPGGIPAPNYIERIDVLKDASSTAIYGARGANGVIVVTAKGPKDRISVIYDGYVQFQTPMKYLPTLNAYDYIKYNWAYANSMDPTGSFSDPWEKLWAIGPNQSFTYTDLSQQQQQISNPQGIDYYKNVSARDATRDVFGNATSHRHELSVTAGSENTKLLFRMAYSDNQGMKVNSSNNGASASLRVDQKISKTINLRVDVSYGESVSRGNESVENSAGSLLSVAYRFRPIATDDVKGLLDSRMNTGLGMFDEHLQDRYNPVIRIKDRIDESKSRSVNGIARLNWDIIEGLTARSEFSLSAGWSRSNRWDGAAYRIIYMDQAGEKIYSGDAYLGNSESSGLFWSNTLSYKVPIVKNHSLDFLVGQEMRTSSGQSSSMYGYRYPASFTMERAFGMMNQYNTTEPGVQHGYSTYIGYPERLISFFGRVNYGLMDRYLFTATMRADASSRFAPTKRWGYFPAAAVAWRLSEESFLKDTYWLDDLKLRFSYGTVGNDDISPAQWKMEWASGGLSWYTLDNERLPFYNPSGNTMSNPYLTWETTVTRNLGIDYSVLKGRIFGSAEVYLNTTSDLLMRTDITAITGYNQTYENIGQTSNRGIEISIGADILRAKDYSLSVNANINFNKNKIDRLKEGVNGQFTSKWASAAIRPFNDYILQEGESIGTVRGYVYDGFYTTNDFTYENGQYHLKPGVPDVQNIFGQVPVFINNPSGQNAYPGFPKYKDVSGPDDTPDGKIDENDVIIIGNMNPKHTGGFLVSGRYKFLDLSLFFNWSYGQQIYNANRLSAIMGDKSYGLYRGRLADLNDCYTYYDIQGGNLVQVSDPAGLDALNAKAKMYNSFTENAVVSSLFIEDGSYLRLNNITLGATFPDRWTRKVGLQSARLYFTMTNVLTLTGYSGLDPEVNANPRMNSGEHSYQTLGMDYGTYPRPRSFVLGLNLEF